MPPPDSHNRARPAPAHAVPVVVTGVGPVSAIGCGRQAFWDALVRGQHGFGPITLCDASRSPSRIAAEVKDFRLDRFVDKGRVLARRLPRPVQFAVAAAALAVEDADLRLDDCDPTRIGVCVGTSIGNVGEWFTTRRRWLGRRPPRPDAAFHLFNHSAACEVSSLFDLRGPVQTVTTGCNSGLDALGAARQMITAGSADAMLVVGTDCEVLPEVLALLNASGSLATRFNDDPGRASRPFDRDRDGNVIGEGAAALLLESEAHAGARRARPYARLAAHAVCAAGRRSYSHNRPEEDMSPCIRTLRTAAASAGWQNSDIDLVNANGSSSVIYDRIEALALATAFGDRASSLGVHSIKSMLGQHGGGSSALQAVAACLSIAEGVVPPTINHDHPDPTCAAFRVVTRAETSSPRKVLVHSIGLGGFYYSCGAFEAMAA